MILDKFIKKFIDKTSGDGFLEKIENPCASFDELKNDIQELLKKSEENIYDKLKQKTIDITLDNCLKQEIGYYQACGFTKRQVEWINATVEGFLLKFNEERLDLKKQIESLIDEANTKNRRDKRVFKILKKTIREIAPNAFEVEKLGCYFNFDTGLFEFYVNDEYCEKEEYERRVKEAREECEKLNEFYKLYD